MIEQFLKTVLMILLIIWVFLAFILLAVSAYRGLVWVIENLCDICKTWTDWVYAILLIDVALMVLVGLLLLLFD